jgi:pyruvate dehydrogenase E2 component (dihydrolipoamide acetyltransferase)
MAVSVTMPVLGLTMEEGTVAEWLKQEGDAVAKDEPLLMVEMDKGTVEVPSPADGVLSRILVQPGETVAVRTPIAELDVAGASAASAASAAPTRARTVGDPPSPAATLQSKSEASRVTSHAGAEASQPAAEASRGERLFATPRARLRARELGVDLSTLRGSGPHGRVVEADVLGAAPHVDPPSAPPAAAAAVAPTGLPGEMSRVRRITAERMLSSAQGTARVTLFLEADFSETVRFRSQLQPEFERLGVAKLPWDAIITKAAALALVEHRTVAAQWADGGSLRQASEIHIGVAVNLEPEGLVVPVLRNADTRTLRDLAADLLRLVDKARNSRLGPEEMQAGVFTVTNLGAYRVDGFTPILNPPETAILGVGRIAERPVVNQGRIEASTTCTLSLSFDHRVVDGAPAAAFLQRLAELLERPYALLGI